MIIQSKERSYLRITIVACFALFLALHGFVKQSQLSMLFSLVLTFAFLVEWLIHAKTTLELSNNKLIIKRTGVFNLIKDDFEIDLDDIDGTYYDKKIYDRWEIYQRFLWELIFPSGQSHLVIHLKNGKIQSIGFDGNEEELMAFLDSLPKKSKP